MLTRKGEQTRARIVAGAADEIRERGVDEVRLEDVMARTRTSKSQLFHYFPDGKEQLLLAVARHEADRVLDDQQPMLGDLTSWAAWERWRERVVERYREQGTDCPLTIVMGHLGRRSAGAQSVVDGLMTRWQAALADGIRHMQASGEMPGELDADRAAAGLLAGVQGGVLLLLSSGRTEHLEAALDLAFTGLRGSATGRW
ncbi:TetR family transcriptional regulator [Actinoplanes philippinensis]|uniref:DNA-binding transcriptional regulator, AcrR family n=1 Tax=Actinoplanes philippinensis TaxID=35752 RepID=A0A1I2L6M1_9ACTN|nr:TetR/AcrR family transcriptional regulator [Actinoplanes philippinensis]GIE82402.1 TetR family transcriptional regulator [Actinoplanes philippinensis]SFF74984.1 DNA-binding transcriptional regulator, AcrR family [Actinoplanes philippinensis]